MAQLSLFGPSPEEAQQMLQQQDQAQAHAFASQMGPQGNPYYVPGIASLFGQAGAGAGRAVQGAFGVVPPEIQKAYTMQEVMQEVDSQGVEFDQDPVGYMKLAASSMLKRGLRDEAMMAIQQAQAYREQESDMQYKGAMGAQAEAVAQEKTELLGAKKDDLVARTALTEAKTMVERSNAEIAQLEEARKAAREPKEIELIDARIYSLKKEADAAMGRARQASSRMSRESANQMYARLLQDQLATGQITVEQAQAKLENAMFDPMRALMQQVVGSPAPAGPTTNPRFPDKPAATPTPVPKPYPATPEKGTTYLPQPGYDYKKAATKMWGAYEPNKYDYRVNPETGKLQRKAK